MGGGTGLKEGRFTLLNHSFITEDGVRFLIRERKKDLGRKPKEYLCSISAGGFRYVSSLFPAQGGNLYKFDFNGDVYSLRVSDGEVEIQKDGDIPRGKGS